MMDEYVLAADYDNLADAYERLKAQYEAEEQRSFYRRPAKVRPPRVEIRVRPEPLDVPAEQTPS